MPRSTSIQSFANCMELWLIDYKLKILAAISNMQRAWLVPHASSIAWKRRMASSTSSKAVKFIGYGKEMLAGHGLSLTSRANGQSVKRGGI